MNTQVKGRKKLTATDARNLRTLLLLSVFEPEDIGERIQAARKESGLTQEELADLVGVSTRSMQGYESGAVVPYRHMPRIAEVTQKQIAWLLHGDESEASPAANSVVIARIDGVEAAIESLRQDLLKALRRRTSAGGGKG